MTATFDEDDEGAERRPVAAPRFILVLRPPDEAVRLEAQLIKRGFTALIAPNLDECLALLRSHRPMALVTCRALAPGDTFIADALAIHAGVKLVMLNRRHIVTIAGQISDMPDLLAALVMAGIRLSPRFMPYGHLNAVVADEADQIAIEDVAPVDPAEEKDMAFL